MTDRRCFVCTNHPAELGMTCETQMIEVVAYCARGCVRPRAHLSTCSDDSCRGCERRKADEGHLCWSCARRLTLILTEMPEVARWLDLHLPMDQWSRVAGDYIKRTKGDPPVPINLAALDHNDTILACIQGWAENLAEDHGHVLPQPRDIPTLSGWLLAQRGSLFSSEWVADCWTELAEITSQAHALAPWRPELRRIHGVPCPECHACALVIYGGDEDVTCQSCRTMISKERYSIWTRIAADEWGQGA